MNLLIRHFIKDYENVSDNRVRNAYGKFSGIVGIVFNLFLFTIKLIAGILSGSVAIIADAVNNLSDAASSIISLVGFRLAGKPADPDHPFGHGRYEYIAGLMVSVFICAIGIELFKTGIDKIFHPEDLNLSVISLVILLISILVKLYMMFFNLRLGKKINSKTLKATAMDSRNDVFSTLAVLIASLIMLIFDINIDGYVGVVVAVFILISGFGLIKETLDPIIGKSPEPEVVKTVSDILTSSEHILGIHDLLIHDYGPGNMFASVHVEMDSKYDPILAHDEIDNLERDVLLKTNIHLVIHYDPIVTDDGVTQELREEISRFASELNPELTIHDLRIVPGVTHTNVVFDMVVPFSLESQKQELRRKICDEVRKRHENYNCVITIDVEYASLEQH